MKRTMMIAAALVLLMTSGAVFAESWEEHCRKIQYDGFDQLTKITCPDNERRGVSLAGECATLLLISRRFVPTAKIPDLATYRMMWSEVKTEICVHFPPNE